MTWVKLDDGFPESPKVVGLTDRAFRVHVRALCYSASHLTDGFVPFAKAHEWGDKQTAELIGAGLWAVVLPDGYQIHDYLDYNPTGESVKEGRRKARERQAKGGRSSGEVRAKFGRSSGEAQGDVRPNFMNPVPVLKTLEPKPSAARTENETHAELLLDSSARPQYLLGKLIESDVRWAKVTSPRLMGLAKEFGPGIVISAVEFISETNPELTSADPYGYLQTVCRSRRDAS